MKEIAPPVGGRCAEAGPGYADELFEAVLRNRTSFIKWGRQMCQSCEIREACLEYGLASGQEYGMWGGLTPPELRRLADLRDGGDAA